MNTYLFIRLFFDCFYRLTSAHSSNSLTRIIQSSRIKIINGHSRYFYGCIINMSKVMRSTKRYFSVELFVQKKINVNYPSSLLQFPLFVD